MKSKMVVVQNVIISRNYPIFVKFHIRGFKFDPEAKVFKLKNEDGGSAKYCNC